MPKCFKCGKQMPKGTLLYDAPTGHVYEYNGETFELAYWSIDHVPEELVDTMWQAWIEDNEYYCPEHASD